MMPNQYRHFSSQPVPSKLKTTNCGAFCPGLSLVILKPSGSVPPAGTPPSSFAGTAVDGTLEPVVGDVRELVVVPTADDDGDPGVAEDEPADEAAEPAGADPVTSLVTVTVVRLLPLVQAVRTTDPMTARASTAVRRRFPRRRDPFTILWLITAHS